MYLSIDLSSVMSRRLSKYLLGLTSKSYLSILHLLHLH